MSALPNNNLSLFQVIQRVEQVTAQLSEIAKVESIDLSSLGKIWATLPVGDGEGVTYLESAGKCIIEVSGLVDKAHPDLSYTERIAKKFRIMSALLSLKADQLD